MYFMLAFAYEGIWLVFAFVAFMLTLGLTKKNKTLVGIAALASILLSFEIMINVVGYAWFGIVVLFCAIYLLYLALFMK